MTHLSRISVALILLLVSSTTAVGKGIAHTIAVRPSVVVPGQAVVVTVTGTWEAEVPSRACPGTRVAVGRPGLTAQATLRRSEGSDKQRRLGGAFTLPLRESKEDRSRRFVWTGRFRPSTVGVWTVVLPNLCGATGYVWPNGLLRASVRVR